MASTLTPHLRGLGRAPFAVGVAVPRAVGVVVAVAVALPIPIVPSRLRWVLFPLCRRVKPFYIERSLPATSSGSMRLPPFLLRRPTCSALRSGALATAGITAFTAALALPLVGCGDDPPSERPVDAADATPDAPAPDVPAEVDAADDVAEDSADDADVPTELPPSTAAPDAPGPHAVARSRRLWTDAARDRTLPVEIWYPTAQAAGAPDDIASFALDDEEATLLLELLDGSPEGCARTDYAGGERGAIAAPLPIAVISHCHECTRWSLASVAERLASHGWLVAAPDHVDNTLRNQVAGDGVALGGPFLITRGEDVGFVLDRLLAADAELPGGAQVDASRVGLVGHSFGAVTSGWVAQRDARVGAVVAIAAPIENPLLPGVTAAEVTTPLLFLLALEDNSIQAIGNTLIRNNFNALGGPAALLEIPDAGHWSFSDINGLVPAFLAGCGEGTRQSRRSETFTYMDPVAGRELAASWATAWLEEALRDNEAAREFLAAPPANGATLQRRQD